ncbi:hypothetical protein YC2023_054034 [Brassica napus]
MHTWTSLVESKNSPRRLDPFSTHNIFKFVKGKRTQYEGDLQILRLDWDVEELVWEFHEERLEHLYLNSSSDPKSNKKIHKLGTNLLSQLGLMFHSSEKERLLIKDERREHGKRDDPQNKGKMIEMERKVSIAIGFDAGVLSCLEYMKAESWSEDEEYRTASCCPRYNLEK